MSVYADITYVTEIQTVKAHHEQQPHRPIFLPSEVSSRNELINDIQHGFRCRLSRNRLLKLHAPRGTPFLPFFHPMAVRGHLPPGANVCFAAPPYQIGYIVMNYDKQ